MNLLEINFIDINSIFYAVKNLEVKQKLKI
jgi:hypothetical protein